MTVNIDPMYRDLSWRWLIDDTRHDWDITWFCSNIGKTIVFQDKEETFTQIDSWFRNEPIHLVEAHITCNRDTMDMLVWYADFFVGTVTDKRKEELDKQAQKTDNEGVKVV